MLKTGQNVHCLMSRCCHIRHEHRKKLKCVNDVEELKDKLKKTNKRQVQFELFKMLVGAYGVT